MTTVLDGGLYSI